MFQLFSDFCLFSLIFQTWYEIDMKIYIHISGIMPGIINSELICNTRHNYSNLKKRLYILYQFRGHSTTTWTKFWPILTPPPSSGQAWTFYIPPSPFPRGQKVDKSPPPLRGQFLYLERGQKQTFLDPLPPSSCPRSYWMPPYFFHFSSFLSV